MIRESSTLHAIYYFLVKSVSSRFCAESPSGVGRVCVLVWQPWPHVTMRGAGTGLGVWGGRGRGARAGEKGWNHGC